MTPEREKEILESRGHNEFVLRAFDCLFAEIDRLRAEFETAAMKCNDWQMSAYKLKKERDVALESVFNMTGQIKELSGKLEAANEYAKHLQRDLGDAIEYQVGLKKKLAMAEEALDIVCNCNVCEDCGNKAQKVLNGVRDSLVTLRGEE